MRKFLPVLAALSVLMSFVYGGVVSIKLTDGSVIKGDVAPLQSINPTQIVVSTDFGVMRLPVEKITDESQKALGIGAPLTAAQYEARIAQLEAQLKSLSEENARLRKEGATAAAPAAPRAARPASLTPTTPAAREAPAASGLSYSISSTGKRHNSRCRYYGTGRACGASDGVACKVCGG